MAFFFCNSLGTIFKSECPQGRDNKRILTDSSTSLFRMDGQLGASEQIYTQRITPLISKQLTMVTNKSSHAGLCHIESSCAAFVLCGS